jgi:predicted RNA-binding protein YlxR (DUF448 family)
MPTPERTCVLTRRKLPQGELVRLVASPDGEVVVDYKGTLPGRGAWIEPTAEVLALLPRKHGVLRKALGIAADPQAVEQALRAAVAEGVRTGLSFGAAAGALVLGFDAIVARLAAGELTTLVLASDIAERTERTLRAAAGEGVTFYRVALTREEFGHRVGKDLIAAAGVPEGTATSYLRGQLRRLEQLG